MKTYILLKDLPHINAGAVFVPESSASDSWYISEGVEQFIIKYPSVYVENSPDWFAEKVEVGKPEIMTKSFEIREVEVNGIVFRKGDTVIHNDETHLAKIHKFTISESGKIWFYDMPDVDSVMDLRNFKKPNPETKSYRVEELVVVSKADIEALAGLVSLRAVPLAPILEMAFESGANAGMFPISKKQGFLNQPIEL